MQRKLSKLMALSGIVMVPVVANGEPIRLDRLTDADTVAMGRGQAIQDAACGYTIIEEIRGYGGPQAMREFTIDFEVNPIVIVSDDGKIMHVCMNGIHTMIDHGEPIVIQKYDEDGRPTMDRD